MNTTQVLFCLYTAYEGRARANVGKAKTNVGQRNASAGNASAGNAGPDGASAGTLRREPVQDRSRKRVQRILDAASDLIAEHGVEAAGTRAIAERSRVPIGSLYQYFASKDEIILALVRRDTQEMDEAMRAAAVRSLRAPAMRTLVEDTMRAFVGVYHHRPAFVVIWFHGRTNAAVEEFCRAHNKQIAAEMHEFALQAGLVRPGTDPLVAELAVAMGDKIFQIAFENDLRGDKWIIAEGIEMVASYLQRYAA
jgi:AcrR family transcriptional regulator